MKLFRNFVALAAVVAASQVSARGDILFANSTSNNGGSSGWAIFFDVTSLGQALNITEMTSFNTGAAGSAFSVSVFVRPGSGLGGPVGLGPGSSSAGWTSLGSASATQGATASGLSLPIDIPDIFVGAGSTVGVAVQFATAGPRYFGTGTAPLQVFSDANLQLTTGDARSAPFTTGGSFFSSRGLAGSLTYSIVAVPEPGVVALVAFVTLGLFTTVRRR